MTRQSRLRFQKVKRGRRIVLLLLLFGVCSYALFVVESRHNSLSRLGSYIGSLQTTLFPQPKIRGSIYDRNLRQVAINSEKVSVYARTREVDSIAQTLTKLESILLLDRDNIQNQMESGSLRVWLARDISQEQEEAVKSLGLKGVHLQKEAARYYPQKNKAAHMLGYVKDGIGLAGVEYYYDRRVSGVETDWQGQPHTFAQGDGLVLSMDLKIQTILEEILATIYKAEKAENVLGCIMAADTGRIIAGGQLPGFDPNQFAKYSAKLRRNLLFDELVIPHIFKSFIRDGSILANVDAGEPLHLPWSVEEFSNQLGRQVRTFEILGFGNNLEVDFHFDQHEPQPSNIQIEPVGGDSVDYGLVPEIAKPVNLMRALSILLNGGREVSPHLVVGTIESSKDSDYVNPLVSHNNLKEKVEEVSQGRITRLFTAMANQTDSGTSILHDHTLVRIKKNGAHRFLHQEVAFAKIPAGNQNLHLLLALQKKPQLVTGKGGRQQPGMVEIIAQKGARISILQQVAQTVADVLEVEEQENVNVQQKRTPVAKKVTENPKKESQQNKNLVLGVMPDLQGLSLRKSLRLLAGLDLMIHIEGTGRVVSQFPRPGTPIKVMTECRLILEDPQKKVPRTAGRKTDNQTPKRN